MPWAGTSRGPQAFLDLLGQMFTRSTRKRLLDYPMPSRALAFWSRMARAASGSIWGSLM